MTAVVDVPARKGVFSWLFGYLKALAFGMFLGMTAITSLIPLGFLMRHMRSTAMRTAGLPYTTVGWILGERGGGWMARLAGGLAGNIREGTLAAFSLGLAVFPFAVIWTLSWFAGWENSFSKGYEQAFVGPSLGLFGVLLFCWTMIWVPMGLAHQAVENRALALFEWRKVRSAVRHSGWGYLALALTTVFFALPLFAGRGLVVFASGMSADFDTLSPEAAASLAGTIALAKAGYAFAALLILRTWAAKIYAHAVSRALQGPDAYLWQDSPLANGRGGGKRSWALTHWMRSAVLGAIWFLLAAQIYIAQFLNHDWHIWVTHPFWFLPWPG